MTSADAKKMTAQNDKSEILDARVVSNYGDPGLDEDYHFDILSRFVVVMIESCDRILTKDKWQNMLAIVQRPEHLWVETAGGVSDNPTTQKRADNKGNVSIGLAANYSVRGVPRINAPYQFGETIKIRRLSMPYNSETYPTFLQSDFNAWDDAKSYYNSWHTDGSTLPFINNDKDKIHLLQSKAIHPDADGSYNFNFYLYRLQYETFVINNNISSSNATAVLTKIFSNQWTKGTPVYSANGGYLFNASEYALMRYCAFEDVNIGNKMRLTSNECIPLVVATPNNFPTPKSRTAGLISYSPTYSPIAR